MIAAGIVLIWIVVFLAVVLIKRSNMLILASKIPGPRGYPLIGNALMFWGKPNEVFIRLFRISQMYKRLVALWIGPKLTVALFDPRDVEIVLRATKIMDKADEYKFLRPWLGDSILLSRGNKFRTNKKIIMPTFHINILKQYIEVFNEAAKELVISVQKEVGKEEFDIQNYFYMNMLSTLLETTMGVGHETLNSSSIINYGHAVSQLCKITHIRSYKLWLRFDSLFKFSKLKKTQDEALNVVHPMTEKVIKRRKEEIEARQEQNYETGEHTKKRSVLLDMLLETSVNGTGLTDQEIKDEVLTMMFAGQDTTSVSLGFILSLLGIYTDIQDKVYAELDEIFDTSDRSATYEDLQKMEYMERVIQETWRLYPPIPIIARKPNRDIALETCVLPASCTVAVIIMILHRNPDHFENPHKFNPDNFLPEKIKTRHPYCFIPFSAGFRTCVGSKYAMLNIKVVLSTLLRNYRVSSKRPEKEFVLVAQTTLKRREGFLVALKPRDNAPLINMIAPVDKNTDNEVDAPDKLLKRNNTKDINDNECDLQNKINETVKTR